MARDTDPRLLRSFVAAAEELHFTRAAARLFVSQQSLSRDIRRLEAEWSLPLFVRTTRQVTLTADGQRLLARARRVLAAHEELAAAVGAAGHRPLIVDIAAPVTTGRRVLDAAREAEPDLEFVARFHSGLSGAAAEMAAGGVDVSFGRIAGLSPALRAGLRHTLIRYERVAVLLPAGHRLAGRPAIALAELAGETLYAGAGNPETTEWTDYARGLFAGRDIRLAGPFPKIQGDAEFVRVVRKRGWSVLASEEFTAVPGMVLCPLTEPVPLSPVSLVWRRGLRHRGLDALIGAAGSLGAAHGWLDRPPDGWLPEADRALLAQTG